MKNRYTLLLLSLLLLLLPLGQLKAQAPYVEDEQYLALAFALAAQDPEMKEEVEAFMALSEEEKMVAFQEARSVINAFRINKTMKQLEFTQASEFVCLVYVDGEALIPRAMHDLGKLEYEDLASYGRVHFSFEKDFKGAYTLDIMVDGAEAVINKYGTLEQFQRIAAEEFEKAGLNDETYEFIAVEQSELLVPLYDTILRRFMEEGTPAEGSEEEDQEAVKQLDPQLIAYATNRAKELSEGTKIIKGIVYCKVCESAGDEMEVLEGPRISTIKSSGQKCFVSFYEEENGNENSVVKESAPDYYVSTTIGYENEQKEGLFGIISLADRKFVPCTSYLDNLSANWDYCTDDIEQDQIDALFQAMENCLSDNGFFIPRYTSSEVGDAIMEKLNTNLVDNEDIKVTIKQESEAIGTVIGNKDPDKEGDIEVIVTLNTDGTHSLALKIKQQYLNNLKQGLDHNELETLFLQLLDDLIKASQLNLCPAGSGPNCIAEQINFLQVINLNLQSLAKNAVIEPSMWRNGSVRNILPDYAKWPPAAGGAVDGLAEEALDIPMLIKTVGEVTYDKEVQKAFGQLFTKEGLSNLGQAFVDNLDKVINDPILLEHAVIKSSVSVVFIYFAIAHLASQGINEVLKKANDLAVKVENTPLIRKRITELVKSKDKVKIKGLHDLIEKVDPVTLQRLASKVEADQVAGLLEDLANNKGFRDALQANEGLVDGWKRLADLGRNQMRKDPSILTSMRKAMDNPDIPSNRLDDIVNSLAESGARCKTCDNAGTDGLRYIDEVLDDLDGFAKDFKGTSGYDNFLREMGEQGTKATGGSWTLEALMRNRSKYFNGETITGFEVKHVPGREFAADVETIQGRFAKYKEFKSWSSNLMGSSNMVDQMAGTMSTITRLEDMQFIFNPSRWKPTAAQFKTALQGKASLFDELMSSGKLQELMPDEIILSTSDFIDNLASPKYFDKVFLVQ